MTTTSTTTRQPSLDECCGFIGLTSTDAYIGTISPITANSATSD
jgi:hypothetical protein